jgi:hypothetical protein
MSHSRLGSTLTASDRDAHLSGGADLSVVSPVGRGGWAGPPTSLSPVVLSARSAVGQFWMVESGSHQTRRWSKGDSNSRSHPKRCEYGRVPGHQSLRLRLDGGEVAMPTILNSSPTVSFRTITAVQ